MEKTEPTVVEKLSDAKKPERAGRPMNRVVSFFRESVWELKRVRWPGRREVVNYTAAALITCIVMGVLVWAFDIGIAKLMSLIGLV